MDLGGKGVGWIKAFVHLLIIPLYFFIVAQMMNVTEQDPKSHP